jgi:hypothetical protein
MKVSGFICFSIIVGVGVEYLERYVPGVSYSFTSDKQKALWLTDSLKQQLKNEFHMLSHVLEPGCSRVVFFNKKEYIVDNLMDDLEVVCNYYSSNSMGDVPMRKHEQMAYDRIVKVLQGCGGS